MIAKDLLGILSELQKGMAKMDPDIWLSAKPNC